jgi:alpha-glucuronidase
MQTNTTKTIPVVKQPSTDGALVVSWNSSAVGLSTNDSFSIQAQVVDGFKCTVIQGQTSRGAVYGAFRLLRELQLQHSLHSVLPLHSSPSGNLRMWDFWDNLDGTVERGYACSHPKSNCSAVWPLTADTNHSTLLRVRDYARILASVGINAVVLQNVNACKGKNWMALSSDTLHSQIMPVARIFVEYGVVPLLSVCFASPIKVGGLTTADPKEKKVQEWWSAKAAELYTLEPMWGGFLVKADSEGNPGPVS